MDTEFVVEERHVTQMVMGYLRERGHFEALTSLQLECGFGEGDMGEELCYLQRLVLQGSWDDLFMYLQPLRRVLLQNYISLECMIKTQQFLEALSYQGAGGGFNSNPPWLPPSAQKSLRASMQVASSVLDQQGVMEDLVKILESIQPHLPSREFNDLCELLTLPSIASHKKYTGWTITHGRVQVFTVLRQQLCNLLPGDNSPPPGMNSHRQWNQSASLLKMVNLGLIKMNGDGVDYRNNGNDMGGQVDRIYTEMKNGLVVLRGWTAHTSLNAVSLVPHERPGGQRVRGSSDLGLGLTLGQGQGQEIYPSSAVDTSLGAEKPPMDPRGTSPLPVAQSGQPLSPESFHGQVKEQELGVAYTPNTMSAVSALGALAGPSLIIEPHIPAHSSSLNQSSTRIQQPRSHMHLHTFSIDTNSTTATTATGTATLETGVGGPWIIASEATWAEAGLGTTVGARPYSAGSASTSSLPPPLPSPAKILQTRKPLAWEVTFDEDKEKKSKGGDGESFVRGGSVGAGAAAGGRKIKPVLSSQLVPRKAGARGEVSLETPTTQTQTQPHLGTGVFGVGGSAGREGKMMGAVPVNASTATATVPTTGVHEAHPRSNPPAPAPASAPSLGSGSGPAHSRAPLPPPLPSELRGAANAETVIPIRLPYRSHLQPQQLPQPQKRPPSSTSNRTSNAAADPARPRWPPSEDHEDEGYPQSHVVHDSSALDLFGAGQVPGRGLSSQEVPTTRPALLKSNSLSTNPGASSESSPSTSTSTSTKNMPPPINSSSGRAAGRGGMAFAEAYPSITPSSGAKEGGTMKGETARSCSHWIRGCEVNHIVVDNAPYPLRCVALVGTGGMGAGNGGGSDGGSRRLGQGQGREREREREREMLTSLDVQFLVGSNNKSVSLYSGMWSMQGGGGAEVRGPPSGLPQAPGGLFSSTTHGPTTVWEDVHKGSVYDLDVQGGLFVSCSNDKAVRLGRLWGGLQGEGGGGLVSMVSSLHPQATSLYAPLRGHTGTVRCVRFSPPSLMPLSSSSPSSPPTYIASAGAGDFKARLWDVTQQALITAFQPHSCTVTGLTWLDQQTFLSADESGYIVGNDVRAPSPAWSFGLSGYSVCTLALLMDPLQGGPLGPGDWLNYYGQSVHGGGGGGAATGRSSLIVAGCAGGAICVFDCRSGKVMASDKCGHSDDVRGVAVLPPVAIDQSAAAGAGAGLPTFATSSFDGTTSIWEIGQRGALTQICVLSGVHSDKVLGCAFVPKTQSIVTTGADGAVVVWSPGGGGDGGRCQDKGGR